MERGQNFAARGPKLGKAECPDPSSHEGCPPGWYFNDDYSTFDFLKKLHFQITFL